jgi:Holliday junction resolvase RusA-like endonuclease
MELRSKQYLIPLAPIPWKRAGVSNRSFYDQQLDEKIAYGLYIARCHGEDAIFDKAVQMDVVFYMTKSQSKKNKPTSIYHSYTPDLSNLIKLLEDAIVDTGVVLTDDRIISIINAQKVYADGNPRTEFTLKEL